MASGFLHGIVALSPTDVWAVGDYDPSVQRPGQQPGATAPAPGNPPQFSPLIEHWDGKAWAIVASPAVRDGILFAVSAISPGDIWAVGRGFSGSYDSSNLLEHWDGKRWSIVRETGYIMGTNLLGVAALAPRDVWAVGGTGDEPATLVERWDGTGWQRVPSPTRDPVGTLRALGVASPADIWAGGVASDAFTLPRPILEHWDGKRWALAPLAATPGYFSGFAAVSPTDVWAAGGDLKHWDGSRWRRVFPAGASPVSAFPAAEYLRGMPTSAPSVGDYFFALAAVPQSTELWAAGSAIERFATRGPCFLR